MRILFFLLSFLLIQSVSAGNLIGNGDFELGNTNFWNASGSNQSISIDNSGSMGGTYAAKINVTASGTLTSTGFYQYMTVPKAITYSVSFKARATSACSIQNVLVQSFYSSNGTVDGFNWLANSNTYSLNTFNQTFTWEFTVPINTTISTGPVSGLCKFIFYYGSATAGTTIYIDDIVVSEKNTPLQTNLCNGDFEKTMSNAMYTSTGYSYNGLTSGTSTSAQNLQYFGWTLAKNTTSTAAATVSTETAAPISGVQSIKITSTGTATSTTSDVQFDWLFGAVKGKLYSVSFRARSSSPYSLPVTFTSWGTTAYIPEQTCALTTSVQTFTLTATIPFDAADNRGVLKLLLGTLPNGVSVWIDDVILAYQIPIAGVASDASMGIVSGATTYEVGTTASLTASPYVGFSFTNWTENGIVVSSNTTYSFTIANSRTLTANFSKNNNFLKTVPIAILPSDSEIINAGRGFYRWNGNEVAPYPSIDRYARYNWTVFETSEGVYNFSSLYNEAAAAYADPDGRGTFGLAFRCVVEGVDHAYPAYLDAKMKSWYSNNKKCWMPDWNNAYFIERHDSLVANLGRAFNKDPRIGFIEIRTYGNWGEWHLSGFETQPSPLTGITTATIQHIIDIFVKAFPDKQLIMMSDNVGGLQYAMSKTGLKYPIGWRRDSWCNSGFNNVSSTSSAAWPLAKDRWKTAPVIIEGYGNTGMTYSLGLQQVIDYHISGIGNGNFGSNLSWSTMTTDAQIAIVNSVKTSGYRYILRDVTTPTVFVPGQSVRLVANWSNIGVAPAYRNWLVKYRLVHPTTGTLIWETPSNLNLRTLLPTYNFSTSVDTPFAVDETFTLPQNINLGTYSLEVLITDSDNYYSPLKLANQNRKSNGAYPIANMVVDTQNGVRNVSELKGISFQSFSGKTIKLNIQSADNYSISVIDTIGKCVFSTQKFLNQGLNNIETTNCDSGIYILNLKSNSKSKSFKIIKN